MSKIWFSTDNLEKKISSDWSKLLKDGSNTKVGGGGEFRKLSLEIGHEHFYSIHKFYI